jgi:hypothetical protein
MDYEWTVASPQSSMINIDRHWDRPRILPESQQAKNRNLSRLISNLSRLIWSSERNGVHCFSTVFTLLQHQEVLVYHVIFASTFPLSFWVQQYVSDLYLTEANWPATLFFFFFKDKHLMHILHIRLLFGTVHSIIICSTISKITVRPRQIGTGGTGVTSITTTVERDPSRLRLCFVQPDLSLTEWVTLKSHYFLSDLMGNTTSKSLLGYW